MLICLLSFSFTYLKNKNFVENLNGIIKLIIGIVQFL